MSFKTRLTLLFVVAMTALVAATSVATYLVVHPAGPSARKSALSLAKSVASIEDPQETSLDRLAGPGARIWLTDASGRVVAQSYSTSGSDSSTAGSTTRSPVRRADLRRRDGRDRTAAMLTCCSPTMRSTQPLDVVLNPARGRSGHDRRVRGGGSVTGRRCATTDRADAPQADAIPGDALDRR